MSLADVPHTVSRHSHGVGATVAGMRGLGTCRCNACHEQDHGICFRSPESYAAQLTNILPKQFQLRPWTYRPRCPSCFSEDIKVDYGQKKIRRRKNRYVQECGRSRPHKVTDSGGIVFMPDENAEPIDDKSWMADPRSRLKTTPHKIEKAGRVIADSGYSYKPKKE